MWCKKTSHSVSARTAANNRSLVNPDIGYACFADWGSLGKERKTLPDVVRVSPDGCMIVLTGSEVASQSSDAVGVRREMFAAVSRRAVLFKLGGFVQPGVK